MDKCKDGKYVLASDYAKLAAENAELRRQCAAFHAEANDHYRASIAANATLDRLRCEFEKWQACDGFTAYDLVDSIRLILYPTPENDNG